MKLLFEHTLVEHGHVSNPSSSQRNSQQLFSSGTFYQKGIVNGYAWLGFFRL